MFMGREEQKDLAWKHQAYHQKKFVLFPNNPKILCILKIFMALLYIPYLMRSVMVFITRIWEVRNFRKSSELLEVKYSYSDLESNTMDINLIQKLITICFKKDGRQVII